MLFQIISFIIGIAIIVATTIIIIKTRKSISKIDVIPNAPKIENISRTEFTDGYYSGIVKTQLPRKNGCTLIEFYPDDIEQGENKARPPIQSFVVKNEFIKRFAKGELSSKREIIKIIGRSPANMPEKMRESGEGKWMAKEGQKAWLTSTFGDGIKAGDEAIAEAMTEYARGEVSRSILAQIKEVNKKFREMQLKVETPEPEKK